jgi:hypothetical protein
MSYQYAAPLSRKADLDGDLSQAGGAATTTFNDPDAADAIGDHVAAVQDAVSRLVEAIGRDEDSVAVHVQGHANPDHAPRAGFADEFISVRVEARPSGDSPT